MNVTREPCLAVVIGAATGIGLAVARRLGAGGLRVKLLDRHEDSLAALAEGLWEWRWWRSHVMSMMRRGCDG